MLTNQTALFNQFKTSLNSAIVQSGMTFDPSIDCRNDLVNFYGYTREQVTAMSDDKVFSIMDQLDGGCESFDIELPVHVQDKKCSCGGKLTVTYVDCETRGDCEIYYCECTSCKSETSFNYASEWYVHDETDCLGDMMNSLDNTGLSEIEVKPADNRSLDDIKEELSVRSYNCLKRAGYETVQEVKDSSLLDMQKIRNLGANSLNEIETLFNIKFN